MGTRNKGASCSSMNLDKGDFFAESEYQVSYGDFVLFQYDVNSFSLDPLKNKWAMIEWKPG